LDVSKLKLMESMSEYHTKTIAFVGAILNDKQHIFRFLSGKSRKIDT
jgi:hypothetical protein